MSHQVFMTWNHRYFLPTHPGDLYRDTQQLSAAYLKKHDDPSSSAIM